MGVFFCGPVNLYASARFWRNFSDTKAEEPNGVDDLKVRCIEDTDFRKPVIVGLRVVHHPTKYPGKLMREYLMEWVFQPTFRFDANLNDLSVSF